MQVADAGGSLRRRWIVVVIGLSLTAAGIVLAMVRLPSEYVSSAQVLLLPPSTEMETTSKSKTPLMSNPYMELDYALSSATDVLVSSLNTTETLDAIEQNGAKVAIARATPESGGSVPPVIVVESTGQTAIVAESAATDAVQAALAELDRMQASTTASRSLWITSRIIEPPTPAQGVIGSRARAAGAILVIGLALTFLAAMAAEGLSRRRRSDAEVAVPDRVQVPAGRP